jgi:hypothetical protein
MPDSRPYGLVWSLARDAHPNESPLSSAQVLLTGKHPDPQLDRAQEPRRKGLGISDLRPEIHLQSVAERQNTRLNLSPWTFTTS